MTFQVGDTVRINESYGETIRSHGRNKPGTEFTVIGVQEHVWDEIGAKQIIHGDPEGWNMWDVFVEKVEPRPFRVGDIVKLTGREWGAGYSFSPTVGTEQEVIKVDGGVAWIDGAWTVYHEGQEHFDRWGAVLVKAAPEPQPLEDWERELLEGPKLDSTGYPVGTPRAAKSLPSTQQIKGTYQDSAFDDADETESRAALLAEFNRWYEQELAEARLEGYYAGVQETADKLAEHTAVVVFTGPFERFEDLAQAEDRLVELENATAVRVTLNDERAVDGFTAQPVVVFVPAEAGVVA